MQQKQKTVRDPGLDLLKYVCAFLVICIHTQFVWQRWILPITRIAVPLFFMISGYYYNNSRPERTRGQIKKIAGMLIAAESLYLLWDTANYVIGGGFSPDRVLTVFKDFYLSRETWRAFLLFNVTRTVHLWYLAALLYVLLIVAALDRLTDRRKFYPLIPLVLAGKLLLGDYAGILLHHSFPLFYTRNFLFVGLPFFLLGDFLERVKDKAEKLETGNLLLVMLLLLPVTVLENELLCQTSNYGNGEMGISTILLVCCVFLLCARPLTLWERTPMRFAAYGGQYYASDIYVVHLMIVQLFLYAENSFLIRSSYLYLAPLWVLALSTLAAAVYEKGKAAGKNVRQRKRGA